MVARRSRPGRWRQGFTALELSGVILVIGFVVCLLGSWFVDARERAREVSCRSNLAQIITALHLYAADYDGHFPHSNDVMVPLAGTYVKNQQVFVCPSDGDPYVVGAPSTEAEDEGQDEEGEARSSLQVRPMWPTGMECSYFIVPGLMDDDPPAQVIAGETAARHRGRWNVACLDGRLDSRPASELPAYWPARSER